MVSKATRHPAKRISATSSPPSSVSRFTLSPPCGPLRLGPEPSRRPRPEGAEDEDDEDDCPEASDGREKGGNEGRGVDERRRQRDLNDIPRVGMVRGRRKDHGCRNESGQDHASEGERGDPEKVDDQAIIFRAFGGEGCRAVACSGRKRSFSRCGSAIATAGARR